MSQEEGEAYDSRYDPELEEETQPSQAHRVASTMSAKDYFLSEEGRLLDQWGDQSLKLFQFTSDVFKSQYQLRGASITQRYSSKYEEDYAKCQKQFEAYCLLSRKVQKKSDEIENIAEHFNKKNHKKNFFMAWKDYSNQKVYLRKMEEKSDKYYQNYRLRSSLKSWLGLSMASNRLNIKNEVLHKTEIEISKIQSEYEKLIKGLEQTLEKRLNELQKEEQEHKLLHNKYQAMYTRSRASDAQI